MVEEFLQQFPSDITVVCEGIKSSPKERRTKNTKAFDAVALYCERRGIEMILRHPSYLQGIYKWNLVLPRDPSNVHEKDALYQAIVYLEPDSVKGVYFREQ
jgi:hypothetical protein